MLCFKLKKNSVTQLHLRTRILNSTTIIITINNLIIIYTTINNLIKIGLVPPFARLTYIMDSADCVGRGENTLLDVRKKGRNKCLTVDSVKSKKLSVQIFSFVPIFFFK